MEIHRLKPDEPPKGYKKEYGDFVIKDDEVYVHSSFANMTSELAAFNASYDGVGLISTGDSMLVPESWAKKENPSMTKHIDNFVSQAKESREDNGS